MITAPSCSKQKCHSLASEKGKFWNSTLPHKMCPRKQTTLPKLLILVSFFSEVTLLYTDTSYYIHVLCGCMPFHFLWATLYTDSMTVAIFSIGFDKIARTAEEKYFLPNYEEYLVLPWGICVASGDDMVMKWCSLGPVVDRHLATFALVLTVGRSTGPWHPWDQTPSTWSHLFRRKEREVEIMTYTAIQH